jgi:hypothetical protein
VKTLSIKRTSRSNTQGVVDELAFEKGVNVIVGRPNTGKTKWLQMVDYALGSARPPEELFGYDLAQKFTSVFMDVEIDGVPATIERRWNEIGLRSKVFLNGREMLASEFAAELNRQLGIPVLHYPQGDMYGKRPWPELSWRGLFRHIYRRQHFWTDLADMQPTSEQHACILQFLGIAERLFSSDFGEMVKQQKRIFELQAKKDQFLATLHEVSRELLDEADQSMALTPESIAEAISNVRNEMATTEQQRSAVLQQLASSAEEMRDGKNETAATFFEVTSEELYTLRGKIESLRSARSKLQERLGEIEVFRANVVQEIERLQRARAAGSTLNDLKVTHCPACDQAVTPPSADQSTCYLCGRDKPSALGEGDQRIQFELEQLKAEQSESDELLNTLRKDIESHALLERSLNGQERKTEAVLRPIRRKAAAILPPELAALDIRAGQLDERLAQLRRIEGTFAKREQLTSEIRKIETTVGQLEGKVDEQIRSVNFEEAAEWLEDGINDYLNALDRRQPETWPHDKINVSLRDRQFHITVGRSKWTAKLGGTLTLYFLIAYHYALLRLLPRKECHYPGLVILDFPPELEGTSVKDKENFVLEPFVDLLARDEFKGAQVVAAGAAFEDLRGANRIELTHVWTG